MGNTRIKSPRKAFDIYPEADTNVFNCLVLPLDGRKPEFRIVEREILQSEVQSKEEELENELHALREKQEDLLNTFKSNFFAKVSHEIRTPLNGIMGIARILSTNKENLTSKIDSEGLIETLLQLSSHLNYVLDEFDHYSQIESIRKEVKRVNTDPRRMLEKLMNSLKYVGGASKEWSLQIADDVPEQVSADNSSLERILFRLLMLGNELNDGRGLDMNLRVDSTKNDKIWLKYSLRIDKSKMSEEAFQRSLFTFDELHTKDDQTKIGTGLGMYLLRTMVKDILGELKSKTWNDSGLVISVRVPVNAIDLRTDSKIDGPIPIDPELRLKERELSFLAVEDNKVNQFVIERFLTKAGQKVKIASNGKEAIDMAAKEKFDLILMDINMPIMTGYEATENIRMHESWASHKSPILALTGSVFKTPEEFKAMGFTDFLLKPYDKEVLFEKILDLIAKMPADDKEA